MAFIHVAQPGETRQSIADLYGVDVSRVSITPNHSDSGLRGGNPNLVLPGDRVVINTGTQVDNSLPPPNSNTNRTTSTSTSTTSASLSEASKKKLASGGYVTFHILTEDGPAEIPVFFSAGIFNALYKTSVWARYGLGEDEPSIQIGLSDNFMDDAKKSLSASEYRQLTQATEPLTFFDEVGAASGDLPPLAPAMLQSGIMWARDPISGEMELIDTQPLIGPSLASFKYSPADPNDPAAGGTWVVVADLAGEERSMFEGVPTSVQPWLQMALDSGGDYNVVPEGPARAWVRYLLDQTIRSSSRPPSQLPFGIGLPNFPGGEMGSNVPTSPWSWTGTALPKKPQIVNIPNPTPTPITQTQQPGYYDVPAAPTQPDSGNPLQQQNGWVLGADGRWRATNPLTGQTPSTTPFVPNSTFVLMPDGTMIPTSPQQQPTSPQQQPVAAAPAPTPPASTSTTSTTSTPQGSTTPKPSASPSNTDTTSNKAPDGSTLPNGWTYDTATGQYKAPNPFETPPKQTPQTVQQPPAPTPPPAPKPQSSNNNNTSSSSSSGGTTVVNKSTGNTYNTAIKDNEVVWSGNDGNWVLRNGSWVKI